MRHVAVRQLRAHDVRLCGSGGLVPGARRGDHRLGEGADLLDHAEPGVDRAQLDPFDARVPFCLGGDRCPLRLQLFEPRLSRSPQRPAALLRNEGLRRPDHVHRHHRVVGEILLEVLDPSHRHRVRLGVGEGHRFAGGLDPGVENADRRAGFDRARGDRVGVSQIDDLSGRGQRKQQYGGIDDRLHAHLGCVRSWRTPSRTESWPEPRFLQRKRDEVGIR